MSWSYTLDGLAVFLEAQRPGDPTLFSRVSTDTRTLQEGDVFFALKGENFDGHEFVKQAFEKGAAAAVVDEFVPGGVCFVVPDTLRALQQFAAAHRKRLGIPLFAVTGSCGKTTTKDLTAALLATRFTVMKTEGNLNNEIGCPLSLLRMDESTEIAVIELGANHAGEIATLARIAQPTESAITLIAPAHLEGFGTIDDVARAKGEIAEALPESGTFYVNVDDSRCARIGEAFAGRTIRFGSRAGFANAPVDGDIVIDSIAFNNQGEMEIALAPIGTLRLPLRARALATNVALAVAVAQQHGITEFEATLRESCAKSARFKVKTIGDLTIIDDTYNANPASMKAALEALHDWPTSGRRIAALGAMLELGTESRALHAEVGRAAAEARVDALFVRGPDADAMAGTARAEGIPDVRVFDAHTDIACAIRESATPGSVVLCKGSRGMRMEKVIEALASDAPAKASTG
jgi:UDP-N-acetylmuramoyl-tripeptide--D-alanyl-D-alanine ligase